MSTSATIVRIEKITPAIAAPRGVTSALPPVDVCVLVTIPRLLRLSMDDPDAAIVLPRGI
jgi:hypothetical protein